MDASSPKKTDPFLAVVGHALPRPFLIAVPFFVVAGL